MDENTEIMEVLQGIDNETVTKLRKILRLKRYLQTGKNVPDECESPVRKRGVRLRETTILVPRNSNLERICQIFSQKWAIFCLFFARLSSFVDENFSYFYLHNSHFTT